MFSLLFDWIAKVGKMSRESKDFVPSTGIRVVNRGTSRNEKWVFIENNPDNRKFVINVFHIDTDFIISIGKSARPNALETFKVVGADGVRAMLEPTKAEYEYRTRNTGRVIVTYADDVDLGQDDEYDDEEEY